MKIFSKYLCCALMGLSLSSLAHGGIVSGNVRSVDGKPLANVPVSDGFEIVVTDSAGNYSMDSNKELGYVFVITPTGYEPATRHGNRPDFWKLITTPVKENDIADFTLRPVDDSRYAFLAIADNQVGNRRGETLFRAADMYIGPVADDNVYRSIRLFETGVLDAEETVKRLKTEILQDQWTFRTEKMLSFLTFIEIKEIREEG